MTETTHGGEADGLAPVIPLFGQSAPAWHPAWTDDPPEHASEGSSDADADDAAGDAREAVERMLTRKLRTRSLSVSEARSAIVRMGHPDLATPVVEEFLRRGYLDDVALADQIVHLALTRKQQGRRAISTELARRGIVRDVADAAVATLPDDDAARALDFARTKARSMRGLDREAALRRLSGQLARRGFPGSVALEAARAALDEPS